MWGVQFCHFLYEIFLLRGCFGAKQGGDFFCLLCKRARLRFESEEFSARVKIRLRDKRDTL